MDEDERNAQDRSHKKVAIGILVLVIVCAAIIGVRYWGRGLPSIGKGASTSAVARENAISLTCHAFAMDLNTYYPAPVTPVGTPIGVILLCRDVAAGEALKVRITHNNETTEIDVTLRSTDTPWNVSNGELGFIESGVYEIAYYYKGKLVARTYVEGL